MAGPIVITGGGTGGHVFPMVAIADQLRALGVDDHDLRFVGSRRGQESTLLADATLALTLLPGRGFRRSFAPEASAQNLAAAALVGPGGGDRGGRRYAAGVRRSWSRSAATPRSPRRWPRWCGAARWSSSSWTPNRAPRNVSSRASRARGAAPFPSERPQGRRDRARHFARASSRSTDRRGRAARGARDDATHRSTTTGWSSS